MSCTIIKDPAINPFFISKDQYCYTVMETITPDKKNLGRFGNKGNKSEGENYEKALGHFSTLPGALKMIVKSKVDLKPEYDTIQDYIGEIKTQQDKMEELLNKIGI